jgi:hypothetical protein
MKHFGKPTKCPDGCDGQIDNAGPLQDGGRVYRCTSCGLYMPRIAVNPKSLILKLTSDSKEQALLLQMVAPLKAAGFKPWTWGGINGDFGISFYKNGTEVQVKINYPDEEIIEEIKNDNRNCKEKVII